MKFIRTVLMTLLLLPSVVLAHPAQDMIVKITSDLLTALEDPKAKSDKDFVRNKVNSDVLPHIDFEAMTKITLGATAWKEGTSEQHGELVDSFRELLLNTYIAALGQYSGQELKVLPYKGTDKDDRIALVRTVFNDANVKYPIDYRLRTPKSEPDNWLVYDIEVEGVSLVKSYQAEFKSQIKSGGIDGLIKTLQDKNAK